MIGAIIGFIIIGVIIGALARLVIPGRQSIGMLLTILLGLVGAFVGGFIGRAISGGWFVQFILSVAVAALLVFLVSGGMRSRRTV